MRASLTGPNPRDAGASKNGKDIVGTSKGCRCGEMGFRRFIKRKERRQKSNGGKKKVDFNGEFYDSKILKLFRGKRISTGAVYMYWRSRFVLRTEKKMTNRCPGGPRQVPQPTCFCQSQAGTLSSPHEPENDFDQDVNKLQDKVFLWSATKPTSSQRKF